MATQRYSVTPHPIDTLLTWVKSGEIAIPEIQRPFVWEAPRFATCSTPSIKGTSKNCLSRGFGLKPVL
jgi:hypothetical protein